MSLHEADYIDDSELELEEDLEEQILEERYNEILKKVPDHDLAYDLSRIMNPELRHEKFQEAVAVFEKRGQLDKELDSGDIDLGRYESRFIESIKPSLKKVKKSSALASIGITGDALGDMAEDHEFLLNGNRKMVDLKDRVKKRISELGPDLAQEEADRLLEEKRIGKDAHSSISRQVRLRRLKGN